MKKKTIMIIIAAVIVLLVVFFLIRKKETGGLQINTSVVHQDSVQQAVTATGYVQPVYQVLVGTQVSGVVDKILVDFNSHVKKGQLLAEIDKSTLIEAQTQAKAGVTSAQSALLLAQQNFDRVKQLYDQKAATQVAYEDAVNQLSQAQTSVQTAQSNLHKANVNLSYAEILSPIDGVILNRAVDQGQTVAASFNTPTLFTIANDLTKMQVEANVDEADIGNVRVGQPVTFTVDAYIDNTFNGHVNEVRLQPTVTNNVVTYTVIIDAPNPEEKLFPGMTANITIVTKIEKGLVVPNEALHFTPTDDVFKYFKMKPKKEPAKTESKTPAANGAPNVNAGATPNFSHATGNKKAIWVEVNDTIARRRVELGISDGVNTIIRSNDIKEGDKVLLSATTAKDATSGAPTRNPLMPQRGGSGRRN